MAKKRGRPRVGESVMTGAERARRSRVKKQADINRLTEFARHVAAACTDDTIASMAARIIIEVER